LICWFKLRTQFDVRMNGSERYTGSFTIVTTVRLSP
jgi:hypothetical protein